MQVPLIDLLKTAEVAHPSVLESLTFEGTMLSMRFRGWPWWKPGTSGVESTIAFVFEEISQGSIGLPVLYASYLQNDEVLEDFALCPLAELPWAAPAEHAIYCAAPLPEPLALFALVHDYLAKVGADYRAEDFLNGADVLEKFGEITASASYLVATVPDVLRSIVCHELDRQNVRYNVITHELQQDTRIRVQFVGTSFLCARAFAHFD
ncbi:MAG: hypothetical protein P4L57_15815 [Rhizomicrobium sp.]|nr:hypothetical protein [Rhizomicrobium sp.]